MPVRRRVAKKPRRRHIKKRVARVPRKSLKPSNQWATCVDAVSADVSLGANLPSRWTVSLSNFERAIAMSYQYEFFRIEEVEYIYKPYANVYQGETSGTPPSIPKIYRMMDRGASLAPTLVDLETFLSTGAKPCDFVREYKIKYKPNTLAVASLAVTSGDTIVGLQTNEVAYNKWLPCNTQMTATVGSPNVNTLSSHELPYFGHWVFINQFNTGAYPVATVDIRVRVSFKNPIQNTLTSLDQLAPTPVHVVSGLAVDPVAPLRVIDGSTIIN